MHSIDCEAFHLPSKASRNQPMGFTIWLCCILKTSVASVTTFGSVLWINFLIAELSGISSALISASKSVSEREIG